MPEIDLRPVTQDNYGEIIELKPRADQVSFVAPNARSLVEAVYEPQYNLHPLAVYSGDRPVGFAMWGIDPDTGRHWIVRLMIDERYQGQGYGRAALLALIDLLKTMPGCTSITLSYEPENTVAERLYESVGFRKTGQMVEDEVESRLELG